MDDRKILYEEIDRKSNEFKKLLTAGWESLQNATKELEVKQKRFEEVTKKLENFHLPEKIVLDVGMKLER